MGNSVSLNFVGSGDSAVILSRRRSNARQPPQQSSANTTPYLQVHSPASSEGSREYMSASESSSSLEASDAGNSPVSEPAEHRRKMRQCWICYGEEEEVGMEDAKTRSVFDASWVAPCQCRGTTKWVHQSCLLEWVDSQVNPEHQVPAEGASGRREGNTNVRSGEWSGPLVLQSAKISCPQCHAPYRIRQRYALPRALLQIIDNVVAVQERGLIWATLGLGAAAVYTVCLSYGMWNGWVVGGHEFLEYVSATLGSPATPYWARMQLSLGMILSPAYALSFTFPRFHWLYPVLPTLLLQPGHPLRITQPRAVMLLIPFAWSVHEYFLNRLLRGIPSDLGQGSRETVSDRSTITPSSSPVTSDELLDDDTDAGATATTIRISILSTTNSLLFPSVAALTGYALSLVLPRPLSGTLSKYPFYRSLVGAGVLVLVRDLTRLLFWYQNSRLNRHRRVLGREDCQ